MFSHHVTLIYEVKSIDSTVLSLGSLHVLCSLHISLNHTATSLNIRVIMVPTDSPSSLLYACQRGGWLKCQSENEDSTN